MTRAVPEPRRVLVVDDEDDIREVAQLSLEMVGGYTVQVAASGPEALAVAVEGRLSAIVLDVMMPGMDGPATLRALRSDVRTCDIPVVLLTAKVQAGEQHQFPDLNVVGVLPKPFDPLRLPGDLAALLGWSD